MKNKIQNWLQAKSRISNEKGFTLIEMMIVVSILAIIMGLVGSNLMGKFTRAKVDTTKLQMKQLGVVLDDFKRECGFYPTTEQGLEALVQKPAGGRECKNYDPSGYTKKVPKDGFGNDFLYESDGAKYTLKSLGADGKEGGEGNDKDLNSDQLD